MDGAAFEEVRLAGPFPATIEGSFEIFSIQDADGEDYYAFGYIDTEEGSVPAYTFGKVLEAAGMEEGGAARAKLGPFEDASQSYPILELRPL